MAKKIKKKTKIKFIPILLLIILLVIGYFLVSFFMNVKIKNIFVKGNKLLSDQEIIELANIEDYPSFIKTTANSIEKKIKKNQIIKDVKVTKSLIATVTIEVTEYDFLFTREDNNAVVVDVNKELLLDKEIVGVPILVNYVPDTVYDKFVSEMKKVNVKVKDKISSIEYKPNDYDKQRFLLYMNDGNEVYVTITRFNLINKYNEIYPTLEGRKGILYLASGNHFEIKG